MENLRVGSRKGSVLGSLSVSVFFFTMYGNELLEDMMSYIEMVDDDIRLATRLNGEYGKFLWVFNIPR